MSSTATTGETHSGPPRPTATPTPGVQPLNAIDARREPPGSLPMECHPESRQPAPNPAYGAAMGKRQPTWTPDRVLKLRRSLVLSVREFGRLVGVSAALVTRWESVGKISPAHLRNLEVISRKYIPERVETPELLRYLVNGIKGDPLNGFLYLIGELNGKGDK